MIFGTSISYEVSFLMRRASDVTFNHSEKLVFSFFLPCASHDQGIGGSRRRLRTVDKLIAKLVANRRRDAEDVGDLLSMLFLAQNEETGEELTDEQIRNEVMGY